MNTFTISDIKQEYGKTVIKTKDPIFLSDKCIVGMIKEVNTEFSSFTFIALWLVPKSSRFNASIYILDDDEYENCGNYIP